jgi:hypothetical protein
MAHFRRRRPRDCFSPSQAPTADERNGDLPIAPLSSDRRRSGRSPSPRSERTLRPTTGAPHGQDAYANRRSCAPPREPRIRRAARSRRLGRDGLGMAGFVRFRSPSNGGSAPTPWLLWSRSSGTVDDPLMRARFLARRSTPARPAARKRRPRHIARSSLCLVARSTSHRRVVPTGSCIRGVRSLGQHCSVLRRLCVRWTHRRRPRPAWSSGSDGGPF